MEVSINGDNVSTASIILNLPFVCSPHPGEIGETAVHKKTLRNSV